MRIGSPVEAVKQGIALITEDRKGEGLLLTQSITANVSLGQLDRLARGGIVDGARETALAEQQIDALRIRTHGATQAVGELSGGNQQKVVIGRWLARDMGVLLFDEPTRGIDVGAKFEIYTLMGALAREGRALVVVSSDLRELMLICDRIGVMSAGRMTAVFERGNWTQDALLAAAFAGFGRETPPGGAQHQTRAGARRRSRHFEYRTTAMTQPPVTPTDAAAQQDVTGRRARTLSGTRLGLSNYLETAGALAAMIALFSVLNRIS